MIFYNNKISSTERTLEDIDNKIISTLSTSTLKDVNIVNDAVKTMMIPVNGVYKEVIQIVDSQNRVIWQKNPDLFSFTYQQVEYISAANKIGAYIDTGIKYDQGCTFELSLIYNGIAYIWGVLQKDAKRAKIEISIDNIAAFNIGYASSPHSVLVRTDVLTVGESYILKYTAKNGIVKVENMTTGHIETRNDTEGKINFTCTDNIYLLGQNYESTPRIYGTRTIKSFKYWDKDDNLLRDMIPCYRKSDNVIGMFDKVSQTFFTNAGTGTFTKGNNV